MASKTCKACRGIHFIGFLFCVSIWIPHIGLGRKLSLANYNNPFQPSWFCVPCEATQIANPPLPSYQRWALAVRSVHSSSVSGKQRKFKGNLLNVRSYIFLFIRRCVATTSSTPKDHIAPLTTGPTIFFFFCVWGLGPARGVRCPWSIPRWEVPSMGQNMMLPPVVKIAGMQTFGAFLQCPFDCV